MNLGIKHNFVLVNIAGEHIQKVRSLYIPSQFNEGAHKTVYGVVKQVPERLLFFKKEIDAIKNEFGGTMQCPVDRREEIQDLTRRSLLYDVPMELKIDDFLFFHYNVYAEAHREGRVFRKGNELFILIPYDMCFVAIREDEIIPLNGLVLLEPLKEANQSEIIITLEKEDKSMAQIAHLGSPVKNYLQYPDEHDDDFFEVGDIVIFRKTRNVPLEYSLHRKLDRKYWKLWRKDLLCKVEDHFVEVNKMA